MENQENLFTKELSLPLFQSKGWMKLIGVMMILYGAMAAVTIVGILIAWLPIWLGVLLFQSASAIEEAQLVGNKAAMLRSLSKLKLYFVITGVLTLLGLLIGLLGLFTGMIGGMMAMTTW